MPVNRTKGAAWEWKILCWNSSAERAEFTPEGFQIAAPPAAKSRNESRRPQGLNLNNPTSVETLLATRREGLGPSPTAAGPSELRLYRNVSEATWMTHEHAGVAGRRAASIVPDHRVPQELP